MSVKCSSKTLEEIEALPKDMLVPADIATFLGCTPYTINVCARDNENPFPFPIIRMGTRVRIPKIPFIKAMRGENVLSKEQDRVECDKSADRPQDIVRYIEALYGITYHEWCRLSTIISKSFDKKRSEAEKDFRLASEKDIINPF